MLAFFLSTCKVWRISWCLSHFTIWLPVLLELRWVTLRGRSRAVGTRLRRWWHEWIWTFGLSCSNHHSNRWSMVHHQLQQTLKPTCCCFDSSSGSLPWLSWFLSLLIRSCAWSSWFGAWERPCQCFLEAAQMERLAEQVSFAFGWQKVKVLAQISRHSQQEMHSSYIHQIGPLRLKLDWLLRCFPVKVQPQPPCSQGAWRRGVKIFAGTGRK